MTDGHEDWLLRLETAKAVKSSRNQLITEYMPFVMKVCATYTAKSLSYGTDDELSVGLMAFSEAIDRYDPNKGNFLAFASLVIKSRLSDFNRAKKYLKNEVAYDFSASELVDDLSQLIRLSNYFERQGQTLRQYEIIELKSALEPYGISFKDLAGNAPKKKELKIEIFKCLQMLWDEEHLRLILERDRKLPIQWMVEQYPIHKKKLERNRKYILLILIIHMGDYPYLQRYINQIIKEALS